MEPVFYQRSNNPKDYLHPVAEMALLIAAIVLIIVSFIICAAVALVAETWVTIRDVFVKKVPANG